MTDPSPRPFAATPQDAPAGIALLVLEGEMDMAAIRAFRAAVDEALGAGARPLVLDLADVGFLDSSMLRELLRVNQELRRQGEPTVLAAPQSAVMRLLQLTRTFDLFQVAATREAAIAGLAGEAA